MSVTVGCKSSGSHRRWLGQKNLWEMESKSFLHRAGSAFFDWACTSGVWNGSKTGHWHSTLQMSQEMASVLMLPQIPEEGETLECFYVNTQGRCIPLLITVQAHPYIEDLVMCNFVGNDPETTGASIDMGYKVVQSDWGVTEYTDDEIGMW